MCLHSLRSSFHRPKGLASYKKLLNIIGPNLHPDGSIVIKTKLNISSPEEYSGSSDLEVYETFVAGILHWLKMNGLLGTKHVSFQVK